MVGLPDAVMLGELQAAGLGLLEAAGGLEGSSPDPPLLFGENERLEKEIIFTCHAEVHHCKVRFISRTGPTSNQLERDVQSGKNFRM